MTNFQRLATVRTRFLNWLQDAEQGSEELGQDGALIHRESMLIRDEFFCGRKFHAKNYTAVWFIEEDVLKVHRADGSLELVLRGPEIDVIEQNEHAAESETTQAAAVLKLEGNPASGTLTLGNEEDTLQAEPLILKLNPTNAEAVESGDASGRTAGPVLQRDEQKTDAVESLDHEIRKAA